MNQTVRVRTWKEFKQLSEELKPDAIVYSIDQNGVSKDKELTCLRLILPSPKAYYVYVDFPKGDTLRETKIAIHGKKVRHLEDQDIIDFLKNQHQRKDLNVYSYWTA